MTPDSNFNTYAFQGPSKRMGPKIPSEFGDISPHDVVFPMVVYGQFKDYRRFYKPQSQEWVDSCWISNEEIKVEKIGKTFLFFCTHIHDRDNLLLKSVANFQGPLLVLRGWFLGASLRSLNFSNIPLWVRLEGLPLAIYKSHVATRALTKLGRIIKI